MFTRQTSPAWLKAALVFTLLSHFLLCWCFATPVSKTKHKVVLVSMDGFRYDYLTKTNNTPNFNDMIESGVTMPYINNTFVTLTFPSHYTIVTGKIIHFFLCN